MSPSSSPLDNKIPQSIELSAQGILLPLFTLASCLLLLLPLTVQIKRRNFPISVLLAGLAVANVLNTINALIWRENNHERWWNGHILCDIEVKVYLGIGQIVLGVPACIFRQLSQILNADRTTVTASPAQKRAQLWFDLIFCIGLPTYVMAVHYLVQPARYEISLLAGCFPYVDLSWVTVLLLLVWSPLTALISVAYGFLTGFRLIKHRQDITLVLSSSSSDLNKSRYLRLFVLCALFVVVYTPLAILFFVQNVSGGLRSGYSWSEVHPPDWSKLIRTAPSSWIYTATRWNQAGAGLVCFAFLGLNQEAIGQYRDCLAQILFQLASWMTRIRVTCHSWGIGRSAG